MEPILQHGGAYWMISSLQPKRGDVVVFQLGWRKERGLPPLVKRVVAMPGDCFQGRRAAGYYLRSDNPRFRRIYGPIPEGDLGGLILEGCDGQQ